MNYERLKQSKNQEIKRQREASLQAERDHQANLKYKGNLNSSIVE
jgi:hypothetical protein